MKPKSRVMCPECGRMKILFETEKKAENFIKWNGDDIDTHGGELRPYYCPACMGYHISSKPFKYGYTHTTDDLIKRYKKDLETSKIIHVVPVKAEKIKEEIKEYVVDFESWIPEDFAPSDRKDLREAIDRFVNDKNLNLNQSTLDGLRHYFYKKYGTERIIPISQENEQEYEQLQEEEQGNVE